jgi:hypothetical protein
MTADEEAATAISAPAGPSSTEMRETLQEKEELSLVDKEEIAGAASYEESLRSALQEVENMKAIYLSLRAATQEAHNLLQAELDDMKQDQHFQNRLGIRLIEQLDEIEAVTHSNVDAIFEVTERLESNEKAIMDLTQRLEVAEAENSLLRARADA